MKSYFSSVVSAIYLTSLVAGPVHAQQQAAGTISPDQLCSMVKQLDAQCSSEDWYGKVVDPTKPDDSYRNKIEDLWDKSSKCKEYAENLHIAANVKLEAGLKLDGKTAEVAGASNADLTDQAKYSAVQGKMSNMAANSKQALPNYQACKQGTTKEAGVIQLLQASMTCRAGADAVAKDPNASEGKKKYAEGKQPIYDKAMSALVENLSLAAQLNARCGQEVANANAVILNSNQNAQTAGRSSVPGMGSGIGDALGTGAGLLGTLAGLAGQAAANKPQKNADGSSPTTPKQAAPAAAPTTPTSSTTPKSTDSVGEGDQIASNATDTIVGTPGSTLASGLTTGTTPVASDCKADSTGKLTSATGADCSTVGATGRDSTVASALTGNSKTSAGTSSDSASSDGSTVGATGRGLAGSAGSSSNKGPLLSGAYSGAGNRGLMGGQEKDPALDVGPASMDTNSARSRSLIVRIGKKQIDCFKPESQNPYYNHSDCVMARAKASGGSHDSAAAKRKQKALAGVPPAIKR
ncbi:MAG: hypothetical protein JST16_09485 [Bdellovibrionales bacterium]|nr:hypothetical protein [Bdellovibrionales bacterium]